MIRKWLGCGGAASAFGGLLLAVSAGAGAAATPPAAICEQVAARVAAESGVPREVLHALTLTETGRRYDGALRPWPWTVNMEGAGHWFDDADTARAFVYGHFRRGARSFDVGCFQINYRWHHQNFDSIEQMFDPLANARYAARFLTDLHGEFGDWEKAAGAYHSRTPTLAARYSARFKRLRARVAATPAPAPAPAPASAGGGREPGDRINTFPLLQAGAAGSPGSLVPAAPGGARLFSAPRGSLFR